MELELEPNTCSLLKADADISAASNQAKTAASKSNWAANLINEGSIKMVMAGTGCENTRKVEEVKKLHSNSHLYFYISSMTISKT